MDDDLYDEFGNYIGPSVSEGFTNGHAEESSQWEHDERKADQRDFPMEGENEMPEAEVDKIVEGTSNAIVYFEDKEYYPDAKSVYGDVEVLVQDTDTQTLAEPIVAPKAEAVQYVPEEMPEMKYNPEFLINTLSNTSVIRNYAVIGQLHHGKTSLMDLFIESAHANPWDLSKEIHYTMQRADERSRLLSVKSFPVTLALPNSDGRHYILNLLDTPGHMNFVDEVYASLRASDGVILVVDVVEGVLSHTEHLIEYVVSQGLPIVLALTKMDRLILDLRMPPNDAYHKLKSIINQVNSLIEKAQSALPFVHATPVPFVSVPDGSVIFCSALHRWSFTLPGFVRSYIARNRLEQKVSVDALVSRWWGDIVYHSSTRQFSSMSSSGSMGLPRSFVHFVLEPLYKLYSHTVTLEPADLSAFLQSSLSLRFRPSELRLDVRPLVRKVLGAAFGPLLGVVDALSVCTGAPDNLVNRRRVVSTQLGEDAESEHIQAILGTPTGADKSRNMLIAHAVKAYPGAGEEGQLVLVRVHCGSLTPGARVRVFDAGSQAQSHAISVISHILLPAPGRPKLSTAPTGSLVLVAGLQQFSASGSTLVLPGREDELCPPFRPIESPEAPVQLTVEPLRAVQLPQLLAGLRELTRAYPSARVRVEESGAHVLFGTGELALDCMLNDLRNTYARIEVRVSEPTVPFRETLSEQSAMPCFAAATNGKSRVSFIAEPLSSDLQEHLRVSAVPESQGQAAPLRERGTGRELSRAEARALLVGAGWDELAARNFWAACGQNTLVNDTLPADTDRTRLKEARDALTQGVCWAVREGPLCEEPLLGVSFRLVSAELAEQPAARGPGMLIPAARRAAYSALLLGSPRLLEPAFLVEILAPQEALAAARTLLARRRGVVVSQVPLSGAPLHQMLARMPVIDSFGFETDLRVFTRGLAHVQSRFDGWDVVPGDPLDESVVIRPLEPSPPIALAREFMLKTRRRKGLSDDISITKYFDQEMLNFIAEQELAKQQLQQEIQEEALANATE